MSKMILPRIKTYTKVPEALELLSTYTGKAWKTPDDLLDAAMSLALPLEASSPQTSRVVTRSYGGHSEFAVTRGWRPALLCPFQIKQLMLTGETTTRFPAFSAGDSEYVSWDFVKTKRVEIAKSKSVITNQSGIWMRPGSFESSIDNDDPWMGESEIEYFEFPIKVTIDMVSVPKHTFIDLLISEGVVWQDEEVVNILEREKSSASLKNTTHRTKTRMSPLNTEIAQARLTAIDPENPDSVFAELVKLADRGHGCLVETVDNAIKYRAGDEVKFFTNRNLRDRMFRSAKQRQGK
ncbi:hypothetical protein ACO0LC_22635 [Undibacterium sp. JH2W]|uniref:hypothetical protein n=1 Tax=Undibacterium TaxID=401469 RepID=UPI003BF05B4A